MSLNVSGAFHTPFMVPARERLRAAIAVADVRDTEIPIVSNVDATAHDQGEVWSALLSAQLSSPVRWKHCLLELADLGVTEIAELGPGRLLTGMARRTITARTISVATPEDLDKLLEWVGSSVPKQDAAVQGEHLFAIERLVVSPAAGIFRPAGLGDGDQIEVGTVLGHVGDHEVRSPFEGVLQSYIAVATERVMPRQPIAWMRTS
jgi:[acyl-carrier-protein] S-malonyltransferase